MTVDQIINFEGDTPSPVTLKDKTILEQNRLFNEQDKKKAQAVNLGFDYSAYD